MTEATGAGGRDSTAARDRMVALLLAVAITALVWVTTPVIPLADGWDTDGRHYGLLLLVFEGAAELGEVSPPWRWRPLAPALASLLPFEPLTSFRVLGMLSAGAGLLLLWTLARRTGLEARWATFAVLLYAGVFWTVKFPAWSPAYVDAETQLLLLGGLLLARDRRTVALVAVLALAGLQKESLAVVAVPAAIAWKLARDADRGVAADTATPPSWRRFADAPTLGRIALLAAVPLGVAFALRLAYPAPPGFPLPPGPLRSTALVLAQDGAPVRLAVALLSGLGLLWALPFAAPRAAVDFLRREPFWAAQIPLGLLLLAGGVDKARLFLYVAPTMAVLGAVVCRAFVGRLRSGSGPSRADAGWVAATLLAHAWLGHHLRPMGSVADYLARLVPVHAPGVPLAALVSGVGVVVAWAAVTWLAGRPTASPATSPAPG